MLWSVGCIIDMFESEFSVRNPAQRGHRFQRKADSIPVIADSR
jgi:hypothetical protein